MVSQFLDCLLSQVPTFFIATCLPTHLPNESSSSLQAFTMNSVFPNVNQQTIYTPQHDINIQYIWTVIKVTDDMILSCNYRVRITITFLISVHRLSVRTLLLWKCHVGNFIRRTVGVSDRILCLCTCLLQPRYHLSLSGMYECPWPLSSLAFCLLHQDLVMTYHSTSHNAGEIY